MAAHIQPQLASRHRADSAPPRPAHSNAGRSRRTPPRLSRPPRH